MTTLGERKRDRIDALAARAGALPEGESGLSLTRSAFRRLRRDPVAILGAGIVLVFLVVAAFAPLLAPRDMPTTTPSRVETNPMSSDCREP